MSKYKLQRELCRMKYYYHEDREYENAQWRVFKTKDQLINYLVGKLGDEWRKEE